MTRDPLAAFAGIAPPGSTAVEEQPDDDVHYPGSKQVRRAVAAPVDTWADYPYVELTLKGVLTRFYSVGVLAERLERKPPAIRKWERLGYIPSSDYRSPGRTKNGQRRLYTRAQIEGLVDIAREEGLIGASNRNVSATAFPARAAALFKELSL